MVWLQTVMRRKSKGRICRIKCCSTINLVLVMFYTQRTSNYLFTLQATGLLKLWYSFTVWLLISTLAKALRSITFRSVKTTDTFYDMIIMKHSGMLNFRDVIRSIRRGGLHWSWFIFPQLVTPSYISYFILFTMMYFYLDVEFVCMMKDGHNVGNHICIQKHPKFPGGH